ncbi:MAG: methylmalonyl-CoA mutase family protein [Flavobacteriales bacterium]
METALNFSEFKKNNLDEWKMYIKKELGEKPFDSLIWEFAQDLSIDPYFENAEYVLNVVEKKTTGWEIAESFMVTDEKETNAHMLKSLEGGINAIQLIFPSPNHVNFDVLFRGVFIQYISISFSGEGLTAPLLEQFKSYVESTDLSFEKVQFSAPNVPSASLDYPIIVDASIVQERGGSAIDQVVYALLKGNEFLESSSSPNDITLHFQFATDPSYFIEIARIRVFRTLWQMIEKAHAVKKDTPKVYSVSSAFFQTIPDRHTNMLRATTQAMSAIIGGTDRLEVIGFESALTKNSSESRRWARNIQHLLLEESYFEKAAQATKGAYYIENLTLSMAGQAWDLFQYYCISAIDNNPEWTNRLQENLDKQRAAIESGSRIMVGLNKYPNKMETLTSVVGTSNRLAVSIEQKMEEKA